MNIGFKQPSKLLRPWVECYRNVEFQHVAEKTETILPNGKIELIFALEGNYKVINRKTHKMNQAWISGIHHEPLHIHYGGDSNLIGIRFYPHGIFPFFHIPIHETVNQVENLLEFWGSFQDEIYEALSKAKGKEQIYTLLDQFLIRKMTESKIKHHQMITSVISQIKREQAVSIPAIASSLGFTQRHFNRLFKDQTGINPKLLGQIFRFEKAFNYLYNHPSHDILDLVSVLGYYDQAHFNKEFKRFSGMTPGEYSKKALEASNFL